MCSDNAAAESFVGTLKKELVNRNDYRSRHHARLSIRYWIEAWYNPAGSIPRSDNSHRTNGRTTTTITRPHKPSVQHLGGTPHHRAGVAAPGSPVQPHARSAYQLIVLVPLVSSDLGHAGQNADLGIPLRRDSRRALTGTAAGHQLGQRRANQPSRRPTRRYDLQTTATALATYESAVNLTASHHHLGLVSQRRAHNRCSHITTPPARASLRRNSAAPDRLAFRDKYRAIRRRPGDGMMRRDTAELAFDVDAGLLIELGERLVARRSVALAELIKNAYDADATEVIVSFDQVRTPRGEITVMDNGSGMGMDKMRHGWMRIATNDATENSRSRKFGRPRTGAKGIGRFACGRLATRLSFESVSRVKGTSERVRVDFDWHDFKPGRDLSDVISTVTREVVTEILPTGTILRLHGLTDTWTQNDIASLQGELSHLMDLDSYRGYVRRDTNLEADPGFDLEIIAPEFPRFEGAIEGPFLEAAWGILTGRVTERGGPQYELHIRANGSAIQHRPTDRSFQSLIDTTFTIRMMVYQGSSFKESGYKLMEARQLGRSRGGVKIYLDGFQVFSYGSSGDDWLDLDRDRARRQADLPGSLEEFAKGLKRPMLSLPSNMQLFGAVAISRENNPELSVSISREQLVHNDSFAQLKRFVRDGINWMTVCYAREKTRASAGTAPDNPDVQILTTRLRSVRRLVGQQTAIPGHVKQTVITSLKEVETVLAQEAEARVTERSMLRVLASAGTTVLLFDHTLRAMAAQLDSILRRLESTVSYMSPDQVEVYQETLDDLGSWSKMATGQGSLVGLLVGSEARTRRRSLAVQPLVETMLRGFDGYIKRFGITCENGVALGVRTPPLHEAEVYAVLLNLLTNSFKAVRQGQVRRVRIEAEANSQRFVLRVRDTGVGVPVEGRQEVFKPFVTTSNPDPVLGVGTGLGLKIVRDLARAWGGDACFTDAMIPWRAVIEVAIPDLRKR